MARQPTTDPQDLAVASQDYLNDICAALAEYVRGGGQVAVHSERDGAPLAITFTLADGDRFHALLRVRMADSLDHRSESTEVVDASRAG